MLSRALDTEYLIYGGGKNYTPGLSRGGGLLHVKKAQVTKFPVTANNSVKTLVPEKTMESVSKMLCFTANALNLALAENKAYPS